MQNRKNQSSLTGWIIVAIYAVFVTSVVAYAHHQHRILSRPQNLQESAQAVLEDTCALQDPPAPAEADTLFLWEDSIITYHSQIPAK